MVDDKEDAGAEGDEAEARTDGADDHQPARTCAPRLVATDGHPNVAGTMVDDEQDAGAKEDKAEAADDADDHQPARKCPRLPPPPPDAGHPTIDSCLVPVFCTDGFTEIFAVKLFCPLFVVITMKLVSTQDLNVLNSYRFLQNTMGKLGSYGEIGRLC
jgi:hypothetical protein